MFIEDAGSLATQKIIKMTQIQVLPPTRARQEKEKKKRQKRNLKLLPE